VSGDLVCVEQVQDGMGEDFSGCGGSGRLGRLDHPGTVRSRLTMRAAVHSKENLEAEQAGVGWSPFAAQQRRARQ
jgi:hypothetical protein